MKNAVILSPLAVFAAIWAVLPLQALAYGEGAPVVIPVPFVHHHSGGGQKRVVADAPSEGGQVLGASVYNFSANLGYGATGQDVIELQKVLIAGGYLHIDAPTGWFGPLTQAAVKQYQAAHGIDTTGFVGPLTRAALNAGTAPTEPEKTSMVEKAIDKVADVVQSVLDWSAST